MSGFDPSAIYQAEIAPVQPTRRESIYTEEMLAPYVEALRESFKTQEARSLYVPVSQVGDVIAIVRAASKITFPEGIGARLRYTLNGRRTGTWKPAEDQDPNDTVRVEFWGGKAREITNK